MVAIAPGATETPTCGLAAFATAAAFRKCTTRLFPASPTYSVPWRSTKTPNGPYSAPGVAKPVVEFQLGEELVMFCWPTTEDAAAPANGKNSKEGNTRTRLLPVSDMNIFPLLSRLTSA